MRRFAILVLLIFVPATAHGGLITVTVNGTNLDLDTEETSKGSFRVNLIPKGETELVIGGFKFKNFGSKKARIEAIDRVGKPNILRLTDLEIVKCSTGSGELTLEFEHSFIESNVGEVLFGRADGEFFAPTPLANVGNSLFFGATFSDPGGLSESFDDTETATEKNPSEFDFGDKFNFPFNNRTFMGTLRFSVLGVNPNVQNDGMGEGVRIPKSVTLSTAVPEPSSFALLSIGAIGLLAYRRLRRKQRLVV